MEKSASHDIRDIKLASEGQLRIEWAGSHMPVLTLIKKRFLKEKPLRGYTIGACLHITTETANLLLTLRAGGAKVFACACNPLSTQDDVAASLVKHNKLGVYAIKGENTKTYYQHIDAVLDEHPTITMDDGGDLIFALHTKRRGQLAEIVGSNEETTTGVIRLRAMEKEGVLRVPAVAVNFSQTKYLFDNRYGTGQSTIDGIMRATNILLSGKLFVVCGYGWCGRGVSMRAHGMGARVLVTEVDPVRALEAVMDGFEVMPIADASRIGDIFVTVTGNKNVITTKEIKLMKDGAILANSGHFNAEIDVHGLTKSAVKKRRIRHQVDELTLKDGTKRFLLGEGRLINLAAAEGHPAEVMDMSFANQALAAEWLIKNRGKLTHKVYQLPADVDCEIASLKLKAMGITIDQLTREQQKYLASWREGT